MILKSLTFPFYILILCFLLLLSNLILAQQIPKICTIVDTIPGNNFDSENERYFYVSVSDALENCPCSDSVTGWIDNSSESKLLIYQVDLSEYVCFKNIQFLKRSSFSSQSKPERKAKLPHSDGTLWNIYSDPFRNDLADCQELSIETTEISVLKGMKTELDPATPCSWDTRNFYNTPDKRRRTIIIRNLNFVSNQYPIKKSFFQSNSVVDMDILLENSTFSGYQLPLISTYFNSLIPNKLEVYNCTIECPFIDETLFVESTGSFQVNLENNSLRLPLDYENVNSTESIDLQFFWKNLGNFPPGLDNISFLANQTPSLTILNNTGLGSRIKLSDPPVANFSYYDSLSPSQSLQVILNYEFKECFTKKYQQTPPIFNTTSNNASKGIIWNRYSFLNILWNITQISDITLFDNLLDDKIQCYNGCSDYFTRLLGIDIPLYDHYRENRACLITDYLQNTLYNNETLIHLLKTDESLSVILGKYLSICPYNLVLLDFKNKPSEFLSYKNLVESRISRKNTYLINLSEENYGLQFSLRFKLKFLSEESDISLIGFSFNMGQLSPTTSEKGYFYDLSDPSNIRTSLSFINCTLLNSPIVSDNSPTSSIDFDSCNLIDSPLILSNISGLRVESSLILSYGINTNVISVDSLRDYLIIKNNRLVLLFKPGSNNQRVSIDPFTYFNLVPNGFLFKGNSLVSNYPYGLTASYISSYYDFVSKHSSEQFSRNHVNRGFSDIVLKLTGISPDIIFDSPPLNDSLLFELFHKEMNINNPKIKIPMRLHIDNPWKDFLIIPSNTIQEMHCIIYNNIDKSQVIPTREDQIIFSSIIEALKWCPSGSSVMLNGGQSKIPPEMLPITEGIFIDHNLVVRVNSSKTLNSNMCSSNTLFVFYKGIILTERVENLEISGIEFRLSYPISLFNHQPNLDILADPLSKYSRLNITNVIFSWNWETSSNEKDGYTIADTYKSSHLLSPVSLKKFLNVSIRDSQFYFNGNPPLRVFSSDVSQSSFYHHEECYGIVSTNQNSFLSHFELSGNTFRNIPGEILKIHPQTLYNGSISSNLFVNCGCKCVRDHSLLEIGDLFYSSGVSIGSSFLNKSSLTLVDNVLLGWDFSSCNLVNYQRTRVKNVNTAAYPSFGLDSLKSKQSGLWIQGNPKNLIIENTITDGSYFPIGIRFSNITLGSNSSYDTYLLSSTLKGSYYTDCVLDLPPFRDPSIIVLQNIASKNCDVNGMVHDLQIDSILQSRGDIRTCDGPINPLNWIYGPTTPPNYCKCPDKPPSYCFCTLETSLINNDIYSYYTQHSYYDSYYFTSINRAIRRCKAVSGVIYLKSGDRFEESLFVSASEEINLITTEPTLNVLSRDTEHYATIKGCSHQIFNSVIEFSNINFENDCFSAPIFQDERDLPVSREITFSHCNFESKNTRTSAISFKNILYLEITDSTFQGFTLGRDQHTIYVEYCSRSLIENCQFSSIDSPVSSLYFNGVGDLTVSSCNFTQVQDYLPHKSFETGIVPDIIFPSMRVKTLSSDTPNTIYNYQNPLVNEQTKTKNLPNYRTVSYYETNQSPSNTGTNQSSTGLIIVNNQFDFCNSQNSGPSVGILLELEDCYQYFNETDTVTMVESNIINCPYVGIVVSCNDKSRNDTILDFLDAKNPLIQYDHGDTTAFLSNLPVITEGYGYYYYYYNATLLPVNLNITFCVFDCSLATYLILSIGLLLLLCLCCCGCCFVCCCVPNHYKARYGRSKLAHRWVKLVKSVW